MLDQSGEGDLRPCIQEDVGKFLPEMNLEEAAEDELVDLANTVGLLEYDIDLRGKPKEFGMILSWFSYKIALLNLLRSTTA